MFKNPKLLTFFFTMIVVMIGFGIIIPIMPFYVEHFGVGGTGLGFMMALFSTMQFIFSPFWGSLSDRYGRKKIMLIGAFGSGLSLILSGLAPNYWLLLAARGLGGILSAATMPTAMAYVGDSTDERGRGGGMGLIGAAMGVGMVIGPGLGGWMSEISLAAPFFLAGGLSSAVHGADLVHPARVAARSRSAPRARWRCTARSWASCGRRCAVRSASCCSWPSWSTSPWPILRASSGCMPMPAMLMARSRSARS